MVKTDTLGRQWCLDYRSKRRGPTRWVVYCDGVCMLQTHNRAIALRYMPQPQDTL